MTLIRHSQMNVVNWIVWVIWLLDYLGKLDILGKNQTYWSNCIIFDNGPVLHLPSEDTSDDNGQAQSDECGQSDRLGNLAFRLFGQVGHFG